MAYHLYLEYFHCCERISVLFLFIHTRHYAIWASLLLFEWILFSVLSTLTFEPQHGKTNTLHRRKQRRRSAKLISAFVFAIRLVQFLFFLNPNCPASNYLLRLYSPVCVGPGRNPNCWFSYAQAHLYSVMFCVVFPFSAYDLFSISFAPVHVLYMVSVNKTQVLS